MSSSQQHSRSIEIPLKDSPDEDASTARRLRDILVELYNQSLEWTKLNDSGIELMQSTINERLRLLNQTAFANADADLDVNASRAKMHRHGEQIVELLEEMERIPSKFKNCGESLNALVNLCKKDGVRHRQTVQAIELTKQLVDMFDKELQCKRATLQDLAESDNHDLLMTCVATWTHQPFLALPLFESLRALTM